MERTSGYLGDGLYWEFDGYQIALKANDPVNPSDTVYLDYSVCQNFIKVLEQLGVK